MNETEGLGSETPRRTNPSRDWRTRRNGRTPWWDAPLAIFAVAVILASAGVALLRPSVVEKEWSAISLSFGSDPISQDLVVKFARVSYIDQPAEFNTTGFGPANLTLNGAFSSNSSGYGILQFNNTTAQTAIASWHLTPFLGANVSYAFVDQRVALNGTTGTWVLELSEARAAGLPPTSGNVSNSSAGAAQNAVWMTATAHANDTWTFTASDWEAVPGNHQTLTTVTLPAAVNESSLQFFEVYLYAAPTQTVVSLVNTTNAAVVASKTIHPVLDKNLTKVGYLADLVTAGSGHYGAAIIDDTFFVDHNAFLNVPGFVPTERPLVSGDLAPLVTAPADPAVQSGNLSQGPASTSSWGNTKGGIGSFSSLLNSSNPASLTSSGVVGKWVVNKTQPAASAPPKYSLATLRAAHEYTGATPATTLYLTSWSPETIGAQINAFLTNYVSAKTGIPAADVEIQEYLISDIQVQTTFSSAAAQTIHNYLSTAIPTLLSKDNLSLVNTTTGAIQAGADIGQFMDPVTGAIYAPQVNSWGAVFDPVNGQTYASAEAAGFPVGSGVDVAGQVYVPDQAKFLGWTASGQPEFEVAGCFLICAPSLSGAAAAVSDFFGSAASTVGNAVNTVTSTAQQEVIKPVSGTLSTDLSQLASDVSQTASNVAPIFGGTVANVAASVSSATAGISNALGSVSGSLASAASGAVGDLLSGVNSFSNDVYHLGASAGTALTNASGAIVNTLGKVVSTAGAVVSPLFAAAANLPGQAAGALESLASLGGSVASAGLSALDSVGHAILNAGGSVYGALSGAWHTVTNAFGSLGNAITSAIGGGTPGDVNWVTGLSSNNGALLTWIVVGVVVGLVVLVLLLVFWWMPRRRKSGHGRRDGREHHERGRSARSGA